MGIFEGYIGYIIAGAFGILQAVLIAMISRESKKRKVDNELRAKESALSMSLQSANMSLSVATAYALKEGRVNGKMDAALKRAEPTQEAYYRHINRVAANQIVTD
ncbi:MAG: hypothetical protein FWC66_05130 [Oscillospiraceae bacterium]|nr:hypothetical protein [Oscillospiraceae bacterium]